MISPTILFSSHGSCKMVSKMRYPSYDRGYLPVFECAEDLRFCNLCSSFSSSLPYTYLPREIHRCWNRGGREIVNRLPSLLPEQREYTWEYTTPECTTKKPRENNPRKREIILLYRRSILWFSLLSSSPLQNPSSGILQAEASPDSSLACRSAPGYGIRRRDRW